MSEKIKYSAKTFEEFQSKLTKLSNKFYPELFNDLSDATLGKWIIDINAAVSDDLSYYTDRMFQETQIDYAKERKSLLSIARNNGIKIPGKRPSIVEVEWSCVIPSTTNKTTEPNWDLAPIIRRGGQAIGSGQKFELVEDLNFQSQFNSMGISNRTFEPIFNTNGDIESYLVKKLTTMTNGESKIYEQRIVNSQAFNEIIIPENNITSIESVVVSQDDNVDLDDFYIQGSKRWYEVDNLLNDKIFMDKSNIQNYNNNIYQGQWKPVTQKFMLEYTDKGYCKLIFGSGMENYNKVYNDIDSNISEYGKYQVNRILSNNNLGTILPLGYKIYVLYRVGGGYEGNVNIGVVNKISKVTFLKDTTNAIKNSMKVTNTTPAVLGRNEPSNDEIKYIIKYNKSSQDRCVTLSDYYAKISTMPLKYGAPFRVGIGEFENKIVISILNIDSNYKLDSAINNILINNLTEYLNEYKMINDYVEIKSGKVINISFDLQILVDKSYDYNKVVEKTIDQIYDYMDVAKHSMGENIYMSSLIKEVSKIDGVINIINIKVYNKVGGEYSPNKISQPTILEDGLNRVNLEVSDNILYSTFDSMYEIKNKTQDISVKVKLI